MENFTKIRAARAELLLEDGQTFFVVLFFSSATTCPLRLRGLPPAVAEV